jgi:hypothetical protein
MGFNTNFDVKLPPWNGQDVCMTLNHEEVLHVITETQRIVSEYVPQNGEPETPADTYVVPEYNKLDWTKAINGATYNVIKGYDPEINLLGIDSTGIIKPVVEEPVEEPVTEEPPVEQLGEEEEPITEGE